MTWKTDNTGQVIVRSSEYPGCELIYFAVVPTSDTIHRGDIGGGCSFYKDGSKGKRVELWKQNWGYLIGEECRKTEGTGKELTERQEHLIKLITGGVLYTRADLASHSRSSDREFHDYIQKAIVPNIVVY